MKAVYFFLLINLFFTSTIFADIFAVQKKIIDSQILNDDDILTIEKEFELFNISPSNFKKKRTSALVFCLESLVKENIEVADLKKDNIILNRREQDKKASIFLGSALSSAVLGSISLLGGYYSYNNYSNGTETKDVVIARKLTLALDSIGGMFIISAVPLLITSIYYYSTGEDRFFVNDLKKNQKSYKRYYFLR